MRAQTSDATLLTVLKGGGRYDGLWVERLARGARAFAPAFSRILCLTDLDLKIAGVETAPLRHGWPGWWSKMEAFRPGLAAGPIVLLDLDTVFAADASALATPGLAAMEDHFHAGRLSSAILRWQGDELAFLYEAFAAEPERFMQPGSCGPVPNAVHGDQVVIDHLLRQRGVVPGFVQRLHPGLLDFYDPAKRSYGPVVIFIGDAKPDGAGEPIRSLWTGMPADAAF
ncbi:MULTISPECIES: hypothetical protein [unclassified Aureimonas]|uniref:hypothetical protein n=1 Tax=unclassified Aureimonas TaxID=2615206 RepID=UPI0006F54DBD|nr:MULTISPECIES: hypothetical protein [unclassified Aureimonas]KQT68932.1 hypothetical protein ASG54_04520 [Aureimonas sp. Leaf460]KQT69159.1 hypothetical protein ASG62_17125 [Aureimonas sp. Leaf427]